VGYRIPHAGRLFWGRRYEGVFGPDEATGTYRTQSSWTGSVVTASVKLFRHEVAYQPGLKDGVILPLLLTCLKPRCKSVLLQLPWLLPPNPAW